MPSKMQNIGGASRKLRLLALTMMLLPMAACATLASGTRHPLVVDTSCDAFQPITYSSRDTPETVAEVKAHNRVYDRLCPSETRK